MYCNTYVCADTKYKTLYLIQTLFWNIPMSNINFKWLFPIQGHFLRENQSTAFFQGGVRAQKNKVRIVSKMHDSTLHPCQSFEEIPFLEICNFPGGLGAASLAFLPGMSGLKLVRTLGEERSFISNGCLWGAVKTLNPVPSRPLWTPRPKWRAVSIYQWIQKRGVLVNVLKGHKEEYLPIYVELEIFKLLSYTLSSQYSYELDKTGLS